MASGGLSSTVPGGRLAVSGVAISTVAGIAAIATALILLPPLFGAVAVLTCAVTLLALRAPSVALNLLLLSIPVQDYGAKGELTLTNALFAATLLGWLLHRASGTPRALPRSIIGPLFILFFLGLSLSLVVAQEIAPGVAVLYQWAKSLLVFFIAIDVLRSWTQVRWALGALAVAGTVEAALGLFQYATKAGPASFGIGEDFSRAYGTFGRPNSYAGYLEMLLPLAMVSTYLAWRAWRAPSSNRIGRLIQTSAAGASTAIIAGAIVVSLSRGAWLGTTSGLVVMALAASARTRRLTLTLAGALLLFAVLGGFSTLPTTLQNRINSITSNVVTPDIRTAYITAENFAVIERLAHWAAGLNMFAANRLLGVGVGNFNVRYAEFNISPTFVVSRGHAHNYYIQVAAEAGLVGLSTYLLLLLGIASTLVTAFRSAAGRDPATRALLVAATGAVTAVAVHDVFEVLHVLSMGIQLSVIWALIVVARQLADHATSLESDRAAVSS